MIFDIEFGDGITIRVKGETFHAACIIAQAQRVMYGEIHEQQLAVLKGVPRRGAEVAERGWEEFASGNATMRSAGDGLDRSMSTAPRVRPKSRNASHAARHGVTSEDRPPDLEPGLDVINKAGGTPAIRKGDES
jgi:hypothetical protein